MFLKALRLWIRTYVAAVVLGVVVMSSAVPINLLKKSLKLRELRRSSTTNSNDGREIKLANRSEDIYIEMGVIIQATDSEYKEAMGILLHPGSTDILDKSKNACKL